MTDRTGAVTTYRYDTLNRVTEILRPNGINSYFTYDAESSTNLRFVLPQWRTHQTIAGNRHLGHITEMKNVCDEYGWVVSDYQYSYDEKGFITGETAVESLYGYAFDDKHSGKHENGRHDTFYPHGTQHRQKHGKDAEPDFQIIETDRSFTYDADGRLTSILENEERQGETKYEFRYDAMGNRTYYGKTVRGTLTESTETAYNAANQPVSAVEFDGKHSYDVRYHYDEDGSLIEEERGKNGNLKVEKTYTYWVENRLKAVYDTHDVLMAAAYDGDGNRVFQLNYNLHTDNDRKGNSGNGGNGNHYGWGNGNSSSAGNGNNGNNKTGGADPAVTDNNGSAYGNTNNTGGSQNRSGILFPESGKVSSIEQELIDLIRTTGKEKNYELIEYVNDVNRQYAETLMELNENGYLDTAYTYGNERLSADRFEGSSYYYLYEGRGSVSAVTGTDGNFTASYRYNAYGEMTFGKPQYENVYGYNGESYNPNLDGQYLRARYYHVEMVNFFTEDSYLGNIREPLSLNRYNYAYSSYLNYIDPSGNRVSSFYTKVNSWTKNKVIAPINQKIIDTVNNLPPLRVSDGIYDLEVKFEIAEGKSEADLCSTLHQIGSFTLGLEKSANAINILPAVSDIHKYLNTALSNSLRVNRNAYETGYAVGELYKIMLLKEVEDTSSQLLNGLNNPAVRLKLDAMLAGFGGGAGSFIGGAGGARLGTLALPGGGTVSLGSLGAIAGGATGATIGVAVSETVQAIVNISLTGVNYAAKTGKENIESKQIKNNENKTSSWNKGSFDSSEESLDYHYKKHGAEVGASNKEEYIRKAEEFAKTARKNSTKSKVSGEVEGVIRYKKNGKYIDIAPDGSIISFGKQ